MSRAEGNGGVKTGTVGVTVETVLQGYMLETDTGTIGFCSVMLVTAPDELGVMRRMIVDTGHSGRRPALEGELARRGLSCSDIDLVVCTHAHWDHVESLHIFPRARIVLHKNERRYIKRPHRNDSACPPWIDSIFERLGDKIWEVEEGVRILPGVEIVDAPGHSAGTMAIAAKTAQGLAVMAGDAIQSSAVARERRNSLVFWNDALATQTIEKLVTIADIIYPGHDQAFRIDGANKVEYVERFSFTLVNARPDMPGFKFEPGTGFHSAIMPGIEEQSLADLR